MDCAILVIIQKKHLQKTMFYNFVFWLMTLLRIQKDVFNNSFYKCFILFCDYFSYNLNKASLKNIPLFFFFFFFFNVCLFYFVTILVRIRKEVVNKSVFLNVLYCFVMILAMVWIGHLNNIPTLYFVLWWLWWGFKKQMSSTNNFSSFKLLCDDFNNHDNDTSCIKMIGIGMCDILWNILKILTIL